MTLVASALGHPSNSATDRMAGSDGAAAREAGPDPVMELGLVRPSGRRTLPSSRRGVPPAPALLSLFRRYQEKARGNLQSRKSLL